LYAAEYVNTAIIPTTIQPLSTITEYDKSPDKQDGTGEGCKSIARGLVFGLSKRTIIQLREYAIALIRHTLEGLS
jgi:hypothetical protein